MKKEKLAPLTLLVVLAWGLAPQFGWAWGRDGHSIVGKIAELRLTQSARSTLREQITDLSLASYEISSWPDEIAHQAHYNNVFPNNSFWHFVDIPYEADEYDAQREGAAVSQRVGHDVGTKNNVVEQIEYWKGVLADKQAPAFKRKTALRFVVHFVGDIHQPLHCTTRNDQGGNGVPVLYLGIYDPHVKLHQVWDDNLVTAARGDLEPVVYAYKLNQKVTNAERQEWEGVVSPRDWAKESHKLAKEVAYPPVLNQTWDQDHPVRLEEDYVQNATPVVEQQLMKAGVRLGKVLNDALGSQP